MRVGDVYLWVFVRLIEGAPWSVSLIRCPIGGCKFLSLSFIHIKKTPCTQTERKERGEVCSCVTLCGPQIHSTRLGDRARQAFHRLSSILSAAAQIAIAPSSNWDGRMPQFCSTPAAYFQGYRHRSVTRSRLKASDVEWEKEERGTSGRTNAFAR